MLDVTHNSQPYRHAERLSAIRTGQEGVKGSLRKCHLFGGSKQYHNEQEEQAHHE